MQKVNYYLSAQNIPILFLEMPGIPVTGTPVYVFGILLDLITDNPSILQLIDGDPSTKALR